VRPSVSFGRGKKGKDEGQKEDIRRLREAWAGKSMEITNATSDHHLVVNLVIS